MHFSPTIFTVLTIFSSCASTTLAIDPAATTPATGNESPKTQDALAKYRIHCNGGNQARCEPGGSANCRCDSYGTFICSDAQCRKMCGCQRVPNQYIEPMPSSTEEDDTRQYRPAAHDDTDIDIIWHNVYADSDFITFRKKSEGPIERILTDFAGVIEANILEEVISVNASKYQFTVVVACSKQWDEISKWVEGVL